MRGEKSLDERLGYGEALFLLIRQSRPQSSRKIGVLLKAFDIILIIAPLMGRRFAILRIIIARRKRRVIINPFHCPNTRGDRHALFNACGVDGPLDLHAPPNRVNIPDWKKHVEEEKNIWKVVYPTPQKEFRALGARTLFVNVRTAEVIPSARK